MATFDVMADFATTPPRNQVPAVLANSSNSIDWTAEFERHQGWLRKVLRCRVKPAIVEDCLQDIALAIVKQDNKPTDVAKVPAWLYRLAIRHSINSHRKNGRTERLIDGFKQNCPEQSELSTDPLDWLLHQEQQTQLRSAIDELRPKDREILVLKYTENWSYKKLATHLGTSTTTVEYRLVKAKKNLRQLLVQHKVIQYSQ